MAKGKKKGGKFKGKGRKKGDAITVKGSAFLTAPANTSTTPTVMVTTRYEIDTDLVVLWESMADCYDFWKINSLVFSFKSVYGTDTDGTVGMLMLDDPENATPTSNVMFYANRLAKCGCIFRNLTLKYRPIKKGWLWTRDASLQDDRFEMPGDFVFMTTATTLSFIPGTLILHYNISFKGLTNPSLNPKTDNKLRIKRELKPLVEFHDCEQKPDKDRFVFVENEEDFLMKRDIRKRTFDVVRSDKNEKEGLQTAKDVEELKKKIEELQYQLRSSQYQKA